MTPKTAPKSGRVGPARMEFQVEFSRGPRGQRRARETEPARTDPDPAPTRAAGSTESRPKPVPTPVVPKITRLLVLGYHFERLVRDGSVKNYAEIARRAGLSRARVTHLVNLTLLPLSLQDSVLRGIIRLPEKSLRRLALGSAAHSREPSR